MVPLVSLVVGCGTPLLGIVVALSAVSWVLAPLDRAAKNRRCPIQFTLGDLFCLSIQFQLALAGPALIFPHVYVGEKNVAMAGLFVAFIAAFVLPAWWIGVRTLSRAGVQGALARAVLMTVVVPFGFVCSIAAGAIPAGVIVIGFLERNAGSWYISSFLLEVVLVSIVFGLGVMMRRLIATANRQLEVPDARSSDDGSINAPYGS
jgi:hypothetical protein